MEAITLTWAGGEHEFALRLGELRKLQESCDAGPEEVLMRLRGFNWRVNDIIEPIRLGLIGSGAMTASKAGPFVTSLMQQHALAEFKITAMLIMAHAFYGPGDDQPEKPEGATDSKESGSSAESTETEAK